MAATEMQLTGSRGEILVVLPYYGHRPATSIAMMTTLCKYVYLTPPPEICVYLYMLLSHHSHKHLLPLSSHRYIQYAKFSGGIFVDANIHDIDLALWYFGADSIIKSVTAVGINARLTDLSQHQDVDNGVGIVEFHNGKIAYFYASRMMAAGQIDTTEIIGTHGKIVVNGNPQKNLVEMHEANGIRREVPQTYYDRFEEAFVTESNEFTECVLDGKELPFGLSGAITAVKIGDALQKSLRTGRKLEFNELGEEIVEDKARL